ncbi:MAG: orotate phosphoribosyltransferase [Gammaproteobacteria bacterium]
MQDYQRDFFDFVISSGVLRFGEFTLKSGRVSPYFFNSGLFKTGASIAKLGEYYAAAIESSSVDYNLVYGPAYKGIPLVVTTSIALFNNHNQDVPYAFNRKEAKDHGEGGTIVGSPLQGKVLIIDDVISAGTSVRESAVIIEQASAEIAGVAIALDRQERGTGATSAIQEIEKNYGIKVISIASLDTLITYLSDKPELSAALEGIKAYKAEYGT